MNIVCVERNALFVFRIASAGCLPHTRKTRCYGKYVIGLGAVFDEFSLSDRTRADKTHFTCQDIPKLRQLVDARLSDEFSERRNARIVDEFSLALPLFAHIGIFREDDIEFFIGVLAHGTEFPTLERFAVFADSQMTVKYRPGRCDFDDKRNDDAQRQHERKRNDEEGDVDGALCKAVRFFCEIVRRCETDDATDVFYLRGTRYRSVLVF